MLVDLLKTFLVFIIVFYSTQVIRKYVRGFYGATFLRSCLFFVPYFVPFYFFKIQIIESYIKFGQSFFVYFISVLVAVLALLWQYPEYKVFVSKDVYYFLPELKFKFLIVLEFSLIGSVISEEVFYRILLPKLLTHYGDFLIICICSVFFTFVHYLQKDTRQSFNYKSYISIFILSLVWGYSTLISNSIIPAMIGHFIYNLPEMLITFYKYKIPRDLNNFEDVSNLET